MQRTSVILVSLALGAGIGFAAGRLPTEADKHQAYECILDSEGSQREVDDCFRNQGMRTPYDYRWDDSTN